MPMLRSIGLQVRQPWAGVEVKAAQPTAEQMEWLEKEGFIKDEEEEEAAEGEEGGDKPKRVRARTVFTNPCIKYKEGTKLHAEPTG